jgi:diguanylate cyclase (GGDEF)-like protein
MILLHAKSQRSQRASLNKSLADISRLRSQNPEILVVIASQEDSFTTRVEVARLGIPCFLQKPIATGQVLASLRQVLTQGHLSSYKLLVVDDDPALLQLIYKVLSPYGYKITLLTQPQKFWEILEQTNPDLLILDVEFFPSDKPKHIKQLPLNGFDLCQIVRSDLRWNRLPILFLSAHTDVETIQNSFAVGANDFLTKPIVANELQTRVRARLEQQQIWKFTEIDALTGVSLRRKTLQDLTRLVQQSQRQQQPFSLAVLDLDLFKCINDKYGHQIGDVVLSYLGQILNQSFRQEDIVGRWGGEEFVVGTKEELMTEVEALRQEVKALKQLVCSHFSIAIDEATASLNFVKPQEYTIVLLEDSEVDRAIYRRFLKHNSQNTYKIIEFDKGEDALVWCQQTMPDILLIDFFLPDMNGLEFLQQLYQQTHQSWIPAIVITGEGNTEIAVEVLKSGAHDYLVKNQITSTSLHQAIAQVIQQHQLIKEQVWQQQQQRLVTKTALSIRNFLNLDDILYTAVTEVRQILQSDRVIIYQFQPDWKRE